MGDGSVSGEMTPANRTPYKDKPAIFVKVEPEVYEAGRRLAAASGSTITEELRRLLFTWLASPPLPGLPTTSEDKPAP